jgi:ubiquitin-conjugating enzyme E2 O
VRFTDDATEELVSLLELDAYGIDDPSGPMSSTHEGLGLRRGDMVLIHKEGTTNGAGNYRVPKLGEVEEWAKEAVEVAENGQLIGWRADMYSLGIDIAKLRGNGHDHAGEVKAARRDDSSLNWLGEVIDVRQGSDVPQFLQLI